MQSHDVNAIHAIVQDIATADHKSHARAPCARQAWCLHGVRERAIREPLRRRAAIATASLCS
eukprot:909467-Lingulodinium_polyedra.AAC.1